MNSNIISISKVDELAACSSKAIGLLHLLAAAAVKEDPKMIQQPTDDEREGIMWLSMDVGISLKAAVAAVERAEYAPTPFKQGDAKTSAA